jgi:hypothetical protein
MEIRHDQNCDLLVQNRKLENIYPDRIPNLSVRIKKLNTLSGGRGLVPDHTTANDNQKRQAAA